MTSSSSNAAAEPLPLVVTPVAQPGVRTNVMWYAGPRLWAKGIQALCVPLYARLLSPAEIGVVVATAALSGIIALAIAPGFEGLYLRWAYAKRSEGGRIDGMGTLLALQLGLVVGGTALLLPLGNTVIDAVIPGIPRWPFYDVMLVTIGVASLGAATRARWRFRGRADKIAAVEVAQSVIAVATTLLALLAFEMGAISLLLGPLIAELVLVPIWLRQIVPALYSSWNREALRLAVPLLFAGASLGLSTWALTALDRIFLQRYRGAYDVGVYGMAFQIGAVVMMMTIVLNKEWQRLVFHYAIAERDRLQQIWSRSICVVAAASSLLIVLSADLASVILGPQFAAAARIIPYILVIAVVQVPRYFLVNLGLAGANSRSIAIESFVAVTVCLLANVVLIPPFGAAGAAVAGIAAYAAGCLFFLSRSWNYLHFDLRTLRWAIVFSGALAVTLIPGSSWLTRGLAIPLGILACREAMAYWRFLGSVTPAVAGPDSL